MYSSCILQSHDAIHKRKSMNTLGDIRRSATICKSHFLTLSRSPHCKILIQHIFHQYLLTMALYGSDTRSFYSTPRPVIEMTMTNLAQEDRMSPQLVGSPISLEGNCSQITGDSE